MAEEDWRLRLAGMYVLIVVISFALRSQELLFRPEYVPVRWGIAAITMLSISVYGCTRLNDDFEGNVTVVGIVLLSLLAFTLHFLVWFNGLLSGVFLLLLALCFLIVPPVGYVYYRQDGRTIGERLGTVFLVIVAYAMTFIWFVAFVGIPSFGME